MSESSAVRWMRDEIGGMFSQSCGNINVPEMSLSRLVEERDRARKEVKSLKAFLRKPNDLPIRRS